MFSALDDREVERLLAGTPTADAELAPIAELVAVLRRSAASEPAPPMTAALQAQLGGAPTVALAARRAGRSALFKAAAAASVAAVLGLGVGASANRLPAGLQDVLSSTANLVGIDVPRSAERPIHSNRSDEDEPRQRGNSDNRGNDGEPGHDGTTPGGATPADPGTPGDHEPAVPATPPDHSNATPGEGKETPVTRGEGTVPVTPEEPVTPDPVTPQEPVTPEEPVSSEEPVAPEEPEPETPGKSSKAPEQAANDEQGATAGEHGRQQAASVGGGQGWEPGPSDGEATETAAASDSPSSDGPPERVEPS